MMYHNALLFVFGVAGVALHNLIKISQQKKATGKFNVADYYITEWPSIAISFIIVSLAVALKGEIKQLEAAGDYLGFGFVAIGYMGQSLFITILNKAASAAGVDTKTDQ